MDAHTIAKAALAALNRLAIIGHSDNKFNPTPQDSPHNLYHHGWKLPDIEGKTISQLVDIFTLLRYEIYSKYYYSYNGNTGYDPADIRFQRMVGICDMAVADLGRLLQPTAAGDVGTMSLEVDRLRAENAELRKKLNHVRTTIQAAVAGTTTETAK